MSQQANVKWGRLLVCALALPGCYTTTVTSGEPAARATVAYDEKWHSGVVNGIAELSGPHDLEKICPHGWSKITTETSFLNGFVEVVTTGIYNPQTVSVHCAVPSQAAANRAPKSAPISSELAAPSIAVSEGPPVAP